MGRRDKPISVENSANQLMGTRLRQARQEKGVPLTELAKRLGYTKGYLSGVENGKERASEEVVRHYERALELKFGELSEPLQAQLTIGPLSFAVVVAFLIKSAPLWLDTLSKTLLNNNQSSALEKGIAHVRSLPHLEEKEQQRHLELVLKNAAERGFSQFYTVEERDQYRTVLLILSESGAHSDMLRRDVLHQFTLSDAPSPGELNEIYNRSIHVRSPMQPTPIVTLDAAPYLRSFFEALIAELYIDPLFGKQMKDVLKAHAAMNMQRPLAEVITTLRQIGETLGDHYTPDQFERDVEVYTAHIERSLHNLKLIGVVPGDRDNTIIDPELNGIFVPPYIALQDQSTSNDKVHGSITDLLEDSSRLVLLGNPGSGKSTLTRYLAWSHAAANQSNSLVSSFPLLSGKPIPLRIELRRLTQDRRYHPGYNFLSYASEVLLGREGVEINPQMFKELLTRKAMLLLFDGLDEVATLDDRQRLVEEIEEFAQRYPGNRILITSRSIGYELAPFSRRLFSHALVQEFDNEQILQFLERWYTYVLGLSPIPHDDQQELETLYMTLKENPRLHTLAANPLLLTVITALHRYERLPDRRIHIYDRCAELLLETWSKLKGTDARWKDTRMGKDDQYACLAHLGFALQERSQGKEYEKTEATGDIATDVPTRFLLREIEHFLNNRRLIIGVAEQHTEAERFLELMRVEAGLIVERGKDENGESLYSFVHRYFQEYFAAADVYERYQQEEDPTIIRGFLNEHLHDPHWREVILLLFGKLKRKPATAQLRRILEGKIESRHNQYNDVLQKNLFFVSSCLIEEVAVENDLVEFVISRLSDSVKNSPVLLQRTEALALLGSLMKTRQYAELGRRELVTLATQDNIQDIDIRIQAAYILYRSSPDKSEEQLQAFRVLQKLVQRPDLSPEQIVQVIEVLHKVSPPETAAQW